MSYPLPGSSQRKIAALTQQHRKCRAKLERSPNSKSAREEMIRLFKEASELIQELDSYNSSLLWPFFDNLRPILREGAELDMEEPGVSAIGEYIETYGAPVYVEDTFEVIPKRHKDADNWSGITVGPAISYVGNKVVVQPDKEAYGTEPWNESMKRHPKSSPLARFRNNQPVLVTGSVEPLSNSVQNALCEISSLQAPPASYRNSIQLKQLQISTDGVCLVLLGTLGAKRQHPWLGYRLLNEEAPQPFTLPTKDKSFQAGLAKATRHMTLDESRKLILVGDKTRVKSFAWGNTRRTFQRALPTHTLDSRKFEGPILTLPNGTILRAGRAAAAVWVIDQLDTHGPKGNSLIGKKIDLDEYEEEFDVCPDIEVSGGTPRTSHIFFNDEPTLEPGLWERLPDSSTVICAEPHSSSEESRRCLTIDFEHNGKTLVVFKGHRDHVSDFSTSATDPRAFLTACSDGCARLFDTRQPYPVIEFRAGYRYDCRSVTLAYPDAVPIVFTGTNHREQIKVWDVRARACMYELATGNNRVDSLAWDTEGNALFAYTSCAYKDKADRYQYRQADIPRRRGASHPNNMSQGAVSRSWPRQAWHSEDYFEYTFDAGEDRVYRYAFKEEPDRLVLPEYGKAEEDSYTIKSYDDEDFEMAYGPRF